jgi:hypothetical protein
MRGFLGDIPDSPVIRGCNLLNSLATWQIVATSRMGTVEGLRKLLAIVPDMSHCWLYDIWVSLKMLGTPPKSENI